jgi:signal transduction histidine kinase
VECSARRHDGEIHLTVRDNGRGISPEFLPHVFERFRQEDASATRAYFGLGLGLSIAKHLVEAHGGTVEAQSDGHGKGSTFTIKLPVASASGIGLRPGAVGASESMTA